MFSRFPGPALGASWNLAKLHATGSKPSLASSAKNVTGNLPHLAGGGEGASSPPLQPLSEAGHPSNYPLQE